MRGQVESSRVELRCDAIGMRGGTSTNQRNQLPLSNASKGLKASWPVASPVRFSPKQRCQPKPPGVVCCVLFRPSWFGSRHSLKAPGPVASLQMRPPTREPPKNERLGAHPSIPQAQPHHPPPAVHRAPPAPVTPCPTKPRTVPCPRVGRRGGAHSQLIVEVNPASTLTASISFVGGGRASGKVRHCSGVTQDGMDECLDAWGIECLRGEC